MPNNADLVNTVSSSSKILKDTVEYDWLVGCTPTAVAIVLGYWDRNGYGNLIEGDSSYFSEDVKQAIASPEHYENYYYPKENKIFTGPIKKDASELGGAHENNSIADFLLTSRSARKLTFGVTTYAYEGVGLHGYAAYKGYDDFETTHKAWGSFRFNDIVAEIDSGRPVILAVDSSGLGNNDHNVVVFGYDTATQEILFQDGWASTSKLQRAKFKGLEAGSRWGIAAATFVTPPKSTTPNQQTQFLHLDNDGSGTASSFRETLNSVGVFASQQKSTSSNLGLKTLGLASADGHTFYQLYNDGQGTATLYQSLYRGDGTFAWNKLSDDSGLGLGTLALATADGKTFYQLYDDGVGTAALYSANLQNDGTFDWQLLNTDSRLGQKTLGLSTTDGKTFYQLYDDGYGTAASYQATLRSNGTFDWELLNQDSGLSLSTLDQVAWQPKSVESGETSSASPVIDSAADPVEEPPSETDTSNPDNSADVNEILGTPADDALLGTANNDRLIAFGGNDYVFGDDGADLFVLGDTNGSFYAQSGWGDSIYIDDFTAGTDQLVLHGSASDYTAESDSDGTWLYRGRLDIEPIAFLNGASSLNLNTQEYI